MNDSISSSLGQYFTLMIGAGRQSSPTEHVTGGADCINAADLAGIRSLLPQVAAKAAGIKESGRLRQRVEILASFLQESPVTANSPAHREAAFVLYYFLKGFDLIPDSIPDIGLLDDSLLVETVLQRNLHELRSHWMERGRVWPEIA